MLVFLCSPILIFLPELLVPLLFQHSAHLPDEARTVVVVAAAAVGTAAVGVLQVVTVVAVAVALASATLMNLLDASHFRWLCFSSPSVLSICVASHRHILIF
jgi:hypothetical protein